MGHPIHQKFHFTTRAITRTNLNTSIKESPLEYILDIWEAVIPIVLLNGTQWCSKSSQPPGPEAQQQRGMSQAGPWDPHGSPLLNHGTIIIAKKTPP